MSNHPLQAICFSSMGIAAPVTRSPYGRAPADLTVTRLVRNLPAVWADQEKQLGFA